MNKIRKVSIVFYSLLFLFAFTSFEVNHSFGNGSGKKDWIPEDFNPKNVTLLIEKHTWNERYNNGMKEFLEKEYPWKYEVVTLDDLQDNTKYKDKKMYQFALLWSDMASRQMGDHVITYHDLEGHFLDRSTDKEYPKSGYGLNRGQTSYKKIFSVLVKKFKDGKDDN